MNDTADEPQIGDRVVVTYLGSEYVAQVGHIVSEDQAVSWYYGTRIVLVLLESGERMRFATSVLAKSPYQNESLVTVNNHD